MPHKIQLRRGLKQDLPALDNGEPGFAQDTEELYIGSTSGNKKLTFDATKYAEYDAKIAERDSTIISHTETLESHTTLLADNAIKPETFSGTDFEKLQQAIDLAITDKRAIQISKKYDIGSNTLDISKAYSPRNPVRFFGGGTIKKSVAGFMFNSSIFASSDYYFDGIRFEGVSGIDVTVFDCSNANIIRLYMDNCAFLNVKSGIYSSTYIQSVFINKALVINVSGGFIDVNGAINCKFTNIIGEDCTGTFINHRGINDGTDVGLRLLSNVAILDSVLEGFSNASNPVLRLKGTNGLTISGNYFEANKGGHIVFDSGTTTYNVNISNNNHFGSADAPALIVWGRDLVKCESNNNSSSVIPIHDTRAVVTGKVISKNDQSPISNLETNSKFLYKMEENLVLVEKGSFTPAVYGTTTAGTNGYAMQVGTYTRQGNLVTCDISIILNAKDAAMAGNIEIGGLPYPVRNKSGYYPGGLVTAHCNITLSAGYTSLNARGKLGTNSIAIMQTGSGNYRLPLPVSGIVFSTEIFIQITYEITE